MCTDPSSIVNKLWEIQLIPLNESVAISECIQRL